MGIDEEEQAMRSLVCGQCIAISKEFGLALLLSCPVRSVSKGGAAIVVNDRWFRLCPAGDWWRLERLVQP